MGKNKNKKNKKGHQLVVSQPVKEEEVDNQPLSPKSKEGQEEEKSTLETAQDEVVVEQVPETKLEPREESKEEKVPQKQEETLKDEVLEVKESEIIPIKEEMN